MTDYKGGDGDVGRIMAMNKQRQKEIDELKMKKEKMREETKSKVARINEKFAANNDAISEKFAQETVGLVTREDFVKKRLELEQEEEKKRKAEQDELEQTKSSKKAKAAVNKLSFSMDDEDEEESADSNQGGYKLGKNPAVNTAFLPDKDREEAEARERERLANEWLEEQERLKNEEIEITYSYYDGSGHRRTTSVKKGTTVDQFLEVARQEFKELRGVSSENLLFVKEDLMIPHHFSFYDLIVSKARGKSGPLFSFDVHEDVRLINDATKEKDESHAGKVVERRWYERNKHIFPASRWEIYDPQIQREKYTIHDRLAKN